MRTRFMRNSDAFTWAMESDPRLRSTVVTVLLLEKSPDWDEVKDRFRRVCHKLPMFRQRVVESPPPAPPRWEDDPDFDLDFHLRRVTAPRPGTLDGVLEMARIAAMEDFDRARPLWEATLIDGLDDGGAAVLCKFHHALTDGVGGVQIAMTLFDLSELSPPHEPLPEEPRVTRPSWLSGYRDAARYDAELAGKALTGVLTGMFTLAPKMLYRGRSSAGAGTGVRGRHRGVGVPDGAAPGPDRFAADGQPQPGAAARRARGADARVARGGPSLRRRAQ